MAGQKVAPLAQRLQGAGPKRILSLDGGGVRGILAAGLLSDIEARLKRRSGRADFRLCDYFDLIGGTSTGSIVAAALAMGRTVAEVAQLYRELAPQVFSAEGANAGIRKPRFDAQRLESALKREFGDHELASGALRTGFAVFAKRLDTGSAWTLSNNPQSRFWERHGDRFPNKHFVIRKLVQASAAAPTFFEHQTISLTPPDSDEDVSGVFVDGGVAGLNNPSLQLLKAATMPSYGFNWQSGADRLLMISVGAGYWRPAITPETLAKTPFYGLAPEAIQAVEALQAMIHDAGINALVAMQGLSETPKPWRINSEIEEMRGDKLTPFPLLLFQRFDVRLDDAREMERLAIRCSQEDLAKMKELASDDPATLDRLYDFGACASRDVFAQRPGDPNWEQAIFPARFDPPWFDGPPKSAPRSRLEAMSRLRR